MREKGRCSRSPGGPHRRRAGRAGRTKAREDLGWGESPWKYCPAERDTRTSVVNCFSRIFLLTIQFRLAKLIYADHVLCVLLHLFPYSYIWTYHCPKARLCSHRAGTPFIFLLSSSSAFLAPRQDQHNIRAAWFFSSTPTCWVVS